jgi:[ribosomal protein S5]-alanine N-acetyltransferase
MEKFQLLYDIFPILSSERCLYKELDIQYAEDIFAIRGDAELMYFVPRAPMKTIDEVPKFIEDTALMRSKREGTLWGIFLTGGERLIGLIGLYRIEPHNHRAEIGYILHGDFHNQGLVTEAVVTMVNFAFNELDLHSLAAVIDPTNIPSKRVLEKTGWKKEAHLTECAISHNAYVDLATYCKINPNH